MTARAPRILADQQAERRLAAQKALTTACAPEDDEPRSAYSARQRPMVQKLLVSPAPGAARSRQSPPDELIAAGFRIFVADARDAFVKFDPEKKRAETKDEAFARRWNELMPLRRDHYCRLAAAALRLN